MIAVVGLLWFLSHTQGDRMADGGLLGLGYAVNPAGLTVAGGVRDPIGP